MATDYDARAEARRTLLPGLWRGCMHPTWAVTAQPSSIDMDESDTAEGIELPGADLPGEELNIVVVPIRAVSVYVRILLFGPSPFTAGQGTA
jgi:hypothetical protein